MARCAYCKTKEAELCENGIPICLSCAELNHDHSGGVQALLVRALSEATLRRDSAFAEFTTIVNGIPSGMPHPNGQRRIHNASAKLAVARHKLIEAHTRLNDYLELGTVPQYL
jgi:hypothetical protein